MNKWLGLFKNLRFRQKLVLSYLIVILIPLLTLGLYSFHQSRLFLHKQAEQAHRETVGTMADSLNARLESYNGIMEGIISHSGFHKIFGEPYTDLAVMAEDIRKVLEPYFNTVQYLNQEIEQITVYSDKNPEFGDYMQKTERVSGEDWYRHAAASGNAHWELTGDALVVSRSFPSMNVNNHTAVLYLRLDRSKVLDEIERYNLDKYAVIIADEAGTILDSNGGGMSPEDLIASWRAAEPNAVSIMADGVSYIAGQKRLPLPGWTLYSYVPVSMVAEDAGSIMKATFVVIALCLGILFILVAVFSHTILQPLRHLNKKIGQIEEGDLQVVVQSSAKDEIGELTNRFGQMLGRINQLIREMYLNRIDQKEAELKALQAQINPHFLYNSLSIIHWKAVMLGADDIGRMVTSLSRFYRTALNRGSNVIAIREEMDNIRSYLDIQLIMHDHSFDVTYSIDDRIYRCDMINLVLQPLVENAIEHGIDLKTDGQRGMLAITAGLEGDCVAIEIHDNGPGIPPEVKERLLTSDSHGYGLKNVDKRLRLFFGEEYGIFIQSGRGEGTAMKLRFPQYSHNWIKN
ncbi:MAG: hypothetical protein K0R57_5248 [Paenibacillaceae bacterium]|jgi:two-component system sensor histidine kinase YesM|nr:hypothetical protein [Paenibacillaceae bacterium]